MTVKLTVENPLQAKKEIEKLVTQGYSHDDIYVFAHDKKRGNQSMMRSTQKPSA